MAKFNQQMYLEMNVIKTLDRIAKKNKLHKGEVISRLILENKMRVF